MEYKLYEVGGKIRDEFLNIDSSDVDYSVVLDKKYKNEDMNSLFLEFVEDLKSKGYSVHKTEISCFTVRGKFPKDHILKGDADFVLARREIYYSSESRKPISVLGTLNDDLIRRDFTVNAIAKGDDGELIDPFSGIKDIYDRILRTPTDAVVSFSNDPLRLLRALRFSVTKGFGLSDEIVGAITTFNPEGMKVVSMERIKSELTKMFSHDTLHSLQILKWLSSINPGLYTYILSGDIWLLPTNKAR